MLFIKNVPIVIEPGVRALEAEFSIYDPKVGSRIIPIVLSRITPDEADVAKLPFIPTTRFPHLFSVVSDLDKASALVLYDSMGRISALFTKDARHKSWERFDVAEEHAGKSVTQYSVRFSFNTQKDRFKFLTAMEQLIAQVSKGDQPDLELVNAALGPLARSRVEPVVLPVAVEKRKLGKIKL